MTKRLACEVCRKEFATPSHLARHVRTHSGEKPFQCEICSKAFTQQSTLKRHSRKHSGEKPFTCDACGKQFGRRDNLNVHIRVHQEEKPFACDLCMKSFTTSGYMLDHIQRAHTGSKNHGCTICGHRFFTGRELSSHSRVHNQDIMLPAAMLEMLPAHGGSQVPPPPPPNDRLDLL